MKAFDAGYLAGQRDAAQKTVTKCPWEKWCDRRGAGVAIKNWKTGYTCGYHGKVIPK